MPKVNPKSAQRIRSQGIADGMKYIVMKFRHMFVRNPIARQQVLILVRMAEKGAYPPPLAKLPGVMGWLDWRDEFAKFEKKIGRGTEEAARASLKKARARAGRKPEEAIQWELPGEDYAPQAKDNGQEEDKYKPWAGDATIKDDHRRTDGGSGAGGGKD